MCWSSEPVDHGTRPDIFCSLPFHQGLIEQLASGKEPIWWILHPIVSTRDVHPPMDALLHPYGSKVLSQFYRELRQDASVGKRFFFPTTQANISKFKSINVVKNIHRFGDLQTGY